MSLIGCKLMALDDIRKLARNVSIALIERKVWVGSPVTAPRR